jgi:peroxiredoxin (alkyl hydroperoxide reductase subunit C)
MIPRLPLRLFTIAAVVLSLALAASGAVLSGFAAWGTYTLVRKNPQTLPTIGAQAPDFEQNSTQGRQSLSRYTDAGKWVVLFSHPMDFTPVCSTEMVAFARSAPEFEAKGIQLIGLSVDGVAPHIAWERELQEKWGVRIPFPILADVDMKVARLYGMIQPESQGTSTVRAVFVIDPKRTVRALVYYPSSCGRSIAEVLRIATALQASDAAKGVCPEGWRPGDPVLPQPPGTQADAEKAMEQCPKRRTWYYGAE